MPRVFVDTNVLVYLRGSTDPDRQEYYVTVTRKLEPGMAEEEAREDVAALRTWSPLVPDLDLLESGWAEQDRYGFSFRDALIVAAARRLGCTVVLTEDLQDGQELGGMVVRNPFTTPPGSDLS